MAIFELRNVRKRFGAVEALKGVSFSVDAGEVVGLMGDNGAGKSTLMKTIAGVNKPDEGEVFLRGEDVSFKSPRDAAAAGIATVYQDLALIDQRTVAENVFLGRELRKGMFLDKKRMRIEAREAIDKLSIRIASVRLPVGRMSGGQRQCIAIARAVHQGGDLVLLDEPTAALGPEQQANVLEVIRDLRRHGKAVVVVSHNVDHVLAVADRVVVMRNGRVQGERRVSETSAAEIVGLILGDTAAAVLDATHHLPVVNLENAK